MRALVFDDAVSGHRALYTKVLSEGLNELGLSVCIALPRPCYDTQEFETHLRPLQNKIEFRKLESTSRSTGTRDLVRWIPRLIKQENSKFVYFPCLDRLALAAGADRDVCRSIASVHGEGLLMKTSSAYPSLGWKRRIRGAIADRVRLRVPIQHLHCLDPISTDYLQQKHGNRRDIRLMPEAADAPSTFEREKSCDLFGVPTDRKYLTCPGTVSERKGVVEMIQAIRHLPKDYSVILAGGHSELIRQHLREVDRDLLEQNRIISIDRYVSNEEFTHLFSIADVVCVPYPRHHGSASILIHAAKANCRITASDWGWIGWATRTFGLGETCDARDPKSIAQAIMRCDANGSFPQIDERRKQFCEYHDRRNHVHHWTAGLRRVLGMDPVELKTFSMDRVNQYVGKHKNQA